MVQIVGKQMFVAKRPQSVGDKAKVKGERR